MQVAPSGAFHHRTCKVCGRDRLERCVGATDDGDNGEQSHQLQEQGEFPPFCRVDIARAENCPWSLLLCE